MKSVWRIELAIEIDRADRAALRSARVVPVSGRRTAGMLVASVLTVAASEEDAKDTVWRVLPSVPIIRTDRMPVFVHAPLIAEHRAALEGAAQRNWMELRIDESADGDLETVMTVPSQRTAAEAIDHARDLYRAAVRDEPPPASAMYVTDYSAFFEDLGRDRELLKRAAALLEDEEYDLAVIVAQTACEVLVADALRSMVAPHISNQLRPWLIDRLSSYTLVDDATRALWNTLTGTRIQSDETLWGEYRIHVRRRNDIVHRGVQVDAAAAGESLRVAQAFFERVADALALSPPPTWASDQQGP